MIARDDASCDDPFDLRRFIDAQEGVYNRALAELQSGQKRTHWMWYIFPQIHGLGRSTTSQYYAIQSQEEARQYLAHPVLGARLRECAATLLALEGHSAQEILGYTDTLKLRSSMTLFAYVAEEPGSVFEAVLDKYFQGKQDTRTHDILRRLENERAFPAHTKQEGA
jgi:uncharacterized protein (DUF1810 family)